MLQIELEGLKREMKNKQVLLAQAGKAIELMEEQHNSEIQKLKREMRELQEAARNKPQVSQVSQLQRQYEPLDNSMQLYADAFNVRQSLLMPPPPSPAETEDQLRVAELHQQLQQYQQELEASKERERQLSEALESKEPEIQIKVH